jgi:RND family efflux transporter MFP subunit
MANILRGKLVVISAIILCALYLSYRVYENKSDAALLGKQTLENAIPTVAVVFAKPVAPTESITLPGNIVGWYEAPIYARVTGYVKMWHKDYGAFVKKGDILAEIFTPDLDAEYAQAKADLDGERAKYTLSNVTAKRWVALRKNHAVSEQSITVQEQNLKVQAAMVNSAEQKVKNIEAFIGFKSIIAPFDGWVIQRNISVGDLVSKEGNLSTPGAKTNLFTVAVVDKLRVFVSVPEAFGSFLQEGLTATVTVPQLPDRQFTAKFLTVAKGFEVSTRTAVTVFTIDNEDRALWPGSYAKVEITAPVNREVHVIPSTTMVFQEHNTQVAVVGEDDRVHLKPITVSKLLGPTIEVAAGVSKSDRIINNPSAALLEGDKVRIVTPAPGYENLGTDAPAPKGAPVSDETPESKKVPESKIAPVLKEASTSHEQATK